jgi:hypothetical protein
MRVMRPAVLILLAMMASGCGDDSAPPTQPSANVPSVAGSWSGSFHIKTCTEPPLLPVAAQICPTLTAGTAMQPVQMVLVQAAASGNQAALSGTITVPGWVAGPATTAGGAAALAVTLPLTGQIDRGGTVLLQATLTRPVAACPTTTFQTTITNLNTTLNRDRDQMTLGVFSLTTRRQTAATGCAFTDVLVDADQFNVALPLVQR